MNDAKPWTTSEWADCEDPADAVAPDGNYMNPVHVARTLATCRQRDKLAEALSGLLNGMIRTHSDECEGETLYSARIADVTRARAVLAKWGTP